MTQAQIKEAKQRKFLEQTKESLFKIVDIVDNFGSSNNENASTQV